MAIHTQEEVRSQQAYQDVYEVKEESNNTLERRYRSQSKSLPAMIINSGLGQALAFLWSKCGGGRDIRKADKKADYYLLQHISHWVVGQVDPTAPNLDERKNNILANCFNNDWDHHKIMRATREALAYLQWNRRYTEALLKSDDDAPGNQEADDELGGDE